MSKSKSNSWLSSVLNNLSGFWSNSPNDASQTPFSRISESSNSSKLKTELPLDTFRSTSSKFSHDSSSEEREFEPVIDCDIAPPSSGILSARGNRFISISFHSLGINQSIEFAEIYSFLKFFTNFYFIILRMGQNCKE